ncbi:Actin cytoskeleton-regulatory complex protein PAN1 [Hondaea fermentalgiana]|uniref:Actin cytoskeleton-regulatory complex protein PAN1 n=1 Tax=Hondaea fermentalgiana TaxID=2315210 RepID=A0A2R5GYT9_9STRA|nr:Actin cytoskeleton-regulatory complex protein PAN1 [Hondaea fermentalgiana]|eukprot:GBG33903.1 Actin cytoskeleton-regulatory complex protein PAN1 [Hondaea fermentalgiana]
MMMMLGGANAETGGEREALDTLWRQATRNGSSEKLSGRAAFEFFMTCGVPRETLRDIWEMADTNKRHFLERPQFDVAVRLICVAAAGMDVKAVGTCPGKPLPLPDSWQWAVPPPAAPAAARSQEPANVQTPTQAVNPRFKKNDRVAHTRTSDGLVRRGVVVGVHTDDAVNGIYYTVRLDEGNHELQAAEHKLRHEAEVDAGSTQAQPQGAHPAQQAPAAHVQQTATSDWSLDADTMQRYRVVYQNAIAKQPSGRMDLYNAQSFFQQSGLDSASISRILQMCDLDRDHVLSELEFCLAFHLAVGASKRGKPLPNQLPPELYQLYMQFMQTPQHVQENGSHLVPPPPIENATDSLARTAFEDASNDNERKDTSIAEAFAFNGDAGVASTEPAAVGIDHFDGMDKAEEESDKDEHFQKNVVEPQSQTNKGGEMEASLRKSDGEGDGNVSADADDVWGDFDASTAPTGAAETGMIAENDKEAASSVAREAKTDEEDIWAGLGPANVDTGAAETIELGQSDQDVPSAAPADSNAKVDEEEDVEEEEGEDWGDFDGNTAPNGAAETDMIAENDRDAASTVACEAKTDGEDVWAGLDPANVGTEAPATTELGQSDQDTLPAAPADSHGKGDEKEEEEDWGDFDGSTAPTVPAEMGEIEGEIERGEIGENDQNAVSSVAHEVSSKENDVWSGVGPTHADTEAPTTTELEQSAQDSLSAAPSDGVAKESDDVDAWGDFDDAIQGSTEDQMEERESSNSQIMSGRGEFNNNGEVEAGVEENDDERSSAIPIDDQTSQPLENGVSEQELEAESLQESSQVSPAVTFKTLCEGTPGLAKAYPNGLGAEKDQIANALQTATYPEALQAAELAREAQQQIQARARLANHVSRGGAIVIHQWSDILAAVADETRRACALLQGLQSFEGPNTSAVENALASDSMRAYLEDVERMNAVASRITAAARASLVEERLEQEIAEWVDLCTALQAQRGPGAGYVDNVETLIVDLLGSLAFEPEKEYTRCGLTLMQLQPAEVCHFSGSSFHREALNLWLNRVDSAAPSVPKHYSNSI